MQTTDRQRYIKPINAIELPCFAPSKRGNGIEMERLLRYAEIGIFSFGQLKTTQGIVR